MNKRKYIIHCSSEEEMNRTADMLIEKGELAERELAVPPVNTLYCGNYYRIVVYEKKEKAPKKRLNLLSFFHAKYPKKANAYVH